MPEPPARTVLLPDFLEPAARGGWMGPDQTVRFNDLLIPSLRARVRAIADSGRLTYGVSVEKSAVERSSGPWSYGGKIMRRRVATFRPDVVFTLLASATGSSRQRLVEIDGQSLRLRDFFPVEIARLMGLPRSFVLPETVGKAMRAFGDGVCVPVVSHLSRHLIEPLARSFKSAGRGAPVTRKEDWRRPSKARSTGVLTMLHPLAHLKLKALAKREGRSLQALSVEAYDLYSIIAGCGPLQRNVRGSNRSVAGRRVRAVRVTKRTVARAAIKRPGASKLRGTAKRRPVSRGRAAAG